MSLSQTIASVIVPDISAIILVRKFRHSCNYLPDYVDEMQPVSHRLQMMRAYLRIPYKINITVVLQKQRRQIKKRNHFHQNNRGRNVDFRTKLDI